MTAARPLTPEEGPVLRTPHAKLVAPLALAAVLAGAAGPGQPQAAPVAAPQDRGTLLLTIFLKHDESKTLGEIHTHLE